MYKSIFISLEEDKRFTIKRFISEHSLEKNVKHFRDN